MRAAGRFKEGRKLLQSSFQPTADSLLAERLISSSLAGPSSVTSVTQVAQRVSNAHSSSAIAGLSRLYSSLTRSGGSGSAAVGPKQQVGFCLVLDTICWLAHSCCAAILLGTVLLTCAILQTNAAVQKSLRRYFSSEPPRKGMPFSVACLASAS